MPHYTTPEEELGHWIRIATNLSFGKASRENALRHIRVIERQLGIEPKDYIHDRN